MVEGIAQVQVFDSDLVKFEPTKAQTHQPKANNFTFKLGNQSELLVALTQVVQCSKMLKKIST